MSSDPIAYTYEADHHCPACTVARFGRCETHGHIAMTDGDDDTGVPVVPCVPCTDRESNEIGAVFAWDEWHVHGETEPPYVLVCGTCGGEITRCEEDE